MTFSSPVVGGNTLIREAIQSPNYVVNVSGWTINADGSAEFNDLTVRGTFTAQSASGAFVDIFADEVSGRIVLQPPNSVTPGVTFGPAQIFTVSDADDPQLIIGGPYVKPSGGFGEIHLGADSVLNQTVAQVLAQQVVLGDASAGSTFDILSPFVRIQGHDLGRGLWSYAGSPTGSAVSAVTTETVMLTIPSTTYKAGRLYNVMLSGRFNQSLTGSGPQLRIRKTNLAGTAVLTMGRLPWSGNVEYAPPGAVPFRVGAADVTAVLVFTMEASAGTCQHTGARSVSTWDIGVGSSMPDVPELL